MRQPSFRLTLHAQQPEAVQIGFAAFDAFTAQPAEDPAVQCDHVDTGRDVQARLFGSGFATLCARCGAEV